MTMQQSYGPAATPTQEPLVVPVDVLRGWRAADAGRRIAAVLALPLALLLWLASSAGALPETAYYGWLLVGPTTFYSLARVLRPEPRSPERTPRHLLAGAATSLAVPVVLGLVFPGRSSDELDLVIVYGLGAFGLGVVTLVWGLVALLVRASKRPQQR